MNNRDRILFYLHDVKIATLDEIIENCSIFYYHNTKKHTGAILSRLVNAGKIKRIKKGVFEINTGPIENKSKTFADKNQLKLF